MNFPKRLAGWIVQRFAQQQIDAAVAERLNAANVFFPGPVLVIEREHADGAEVDFLVFDYAAVPGHRVLRVGTTPLGVAMDTWRQELQRQETSL